MTPPHWLAHRGGRLLESRNQRRTRGPPKGSLVANFLTIRGFVCSAVELRNTQTGLVVGNFRMGSTHRRQDPITNVWVDGDTNWFRINVFRALAQNAVSIHKGDRIIVVGRLHLVNYLRKDGNPGISVEIDAESIGPDLQFGTALYARMGAQRQAGGSAIQKDSGPQGLETPAGAGEDPADHEADRDEAPDLDLDAELATLDPNGAETDGELDEGETVDKETGELSSGKVPF
ncbi:hypothetical protein B5P43_13425 [Bacillus sp. SRB_336]|nr:hypothetical protein B5P43_13425 [Bacillus sp. SRB_336]